MATVTTVPPALTEQLPGPPSLIGLIPGMDLRLYKEYQPGLILEMADELEKGKLYIGVLWQNTDKTYTLNEYGTKGMGAPSLTTGSNGGFRLYEVMGGYVNDWRNPVIKEFGKQDWRSPHDLPPTGETGPIVLTELAFPYTGEWQFVEGYRYVFTLLDIKNSNYFKPVLTLSATDAGNYLRSRPHPGLGNAAGLDVRWRIYQFDDKDANPIILVTQQLEREGFHPAPSGRYCSNTPGSESDICK
jgi:hypothetical protein